MYLGCKWYGWYAVLGTRHTAIFEISGQIVNTYKVFTGLALPLYTATSLYIIVFSLEFCLRPGNIIWLLYLEQVDSFKAKTWLIYYDRGGGCLVDPNFLLFLISSCGVKLRLQTKNQYPRLPGSTLKGCVEMLWWLYWNVLAAILVLKANLVLCFGPNHDFWYSFRLGPRWTICQCELQQKIRGCVDKTCTLPYTAMQCFLKQDGRVK